MSMQAVFRRFAATLAVVALSGAGLGAETVPVAGSCSCGDQADAFIPKVVLDTDIGGDYDDVGALAAMHALADLGECEVLAVGSCSTSRDAVPCIEILNDYYGRTFLPVGGVPDWPLKPRACGDFWHKVKWPEVLKAKYPRFRHRTSAEAPDAVRVYRRALADAPDGSVVFIAVGNMTNLPRLLDSKPDFLSPLAGRDLVARKVRRLVIMGGEFPSGRECNLKGDVRASQRLFAEWPTLVVCAGYEIGTPVLTGRRLIQLPDEGNPVRDAYFTAMSQGGNRGRNSWDQTAVLAAIRPVDRYFGIERGRVTVKEDGSNTWAAEPAGPHARLLAKLPPDELAQVIEELMMRQPAVQTSRMPK